MEPVERATRIDLSAFEQGAMAFLENPQKAKDWLNSIPFEPDTTEHDQFIEGIAAAEHGYLDVYTRARIDMAKRNAGGLTDEEHIRNLAKKASKLSRSTPVNEIEAIIKESLTYFRKHGL